MNITEETGNRIRYYRQLRKFSQEQLAEYSDLHPSYIGQLERGEKTPSIDTLYKISKGLNISLSTLFEEIEECTDQPDSFAYKGYQLIERQTVKNQEHLYYILDEIMKMDI